MTHDQHSEPYLDLPLDVFGQQPGLYKLYTQISFIFPIPEDVPNDNVIAKLTSALHILCKSFPWIGGSVVKADDIDDGKPYRIRARCGSAGWLPHSQDYRRDVTKRFHVLDRAAWPMVMLDESWLCPRNTLGMLDKHTEATVLEVQATFIEGGVIVSFVGQHNVLDMTGLTEVIRLFNSACHRDFTEEELVLGNSLTAFKVPILGRDWEPDWTADRYIKPVGTEVVAEDSPAATWTYFNFSAKALNDLKAEATSHKDVEYISTDDAVTAFIWKSISRARRIRIPSSSPVTIGRAIDPRLFIGFPPNFPGFIMNMTYHSSSGDSLEDRSLGNLASEFRRAVDPNSSQIGVTTRTFAALLDRAVDKNAISVTAKLDLSKDIAFSSWSKYDLAGFDFGLGLGPPTTVRRPRFIPVEGLMYLMPKARDESIALAICLRDTDLTELKTDVVFSIYADFIG